MNDEAVLAVLNQLREQNNQLREQSNEILERLAEVPTKAEFNSVQEKVLRSYAWIEGNGTPGARLRLVQVEDKVNGLATDIKGAPDKTMKDITWSVAKTFGVPLILAVVTWLGSIVLYISAIMPANK